MTIKSLASKIVKLGGTVEINGYTLTGELNGYDVEMQGSKYEDGANFYTVRKISKRGTYDAGSDYNTGDYIFLEKINQLEWATSLI
jgi:hypothetical protein